MTVNDIVIDLWCDLLETLDYEAGMAAVRAYAEMPDQTDPPHVGGLVNYARNYEKRNKATVKRLAEPEPSEEEVAESKRILKEMIEKLERK